VGPGKTKPCGDYLNHLHPQPLEMSRRVRKSLIIVRKHTPSRRRDALSVKTQTREIDWGTLVTRCGSVIQQYRVKWWFLFGLPQWRWWASDQHPFQVTESNIPDLHIYIIRWRGSTPQTAGSQPYSHFADYSNPQVMQMVVCDLDKAKLQPSDHACLHPYSTVPLFLRFPLLITHITASILVCRLYKIAYNHYINTWRPINL